MESTSHLSPESLAALAEGTLPTPQRVSAEAHLSQCPECFEAYSEVVQVRIESEIKPEEFTANQDWIAAGHRVAGGGVSDSSSRRMFPRWRFAIVLPAVIVVIVAGVWIQRDRAWDKTIAPVQEAISVASHYGLVYPEANLEAFGPDTAYRSGNAAMVTELNPSIEDLRRQNQANPMNRDVAFWLAAGLIESGQLGTARSALDRTQVRFSEDIGLKILDAILSAREQDFDRAQILLEEVMGGMDATDTERQLAETNLNFLQTFLKSQD